MLDSFKWQELIFFFRFTSESNHMDLVLLMHQCSNYSQKQPLVEQGYLELNHQQFDQAHQNIFSRKLDQLQLCQQFRRRGIQGLPHRKGHQYLQHKQGQPLDHNSYEGLDDVEHGGVVGHMDQGHDVRDHRGQGHDGGHDEEHDEGHDVQEHGGAQVNKELDGTGGPHLHIQVQMALIRQSPENDKMVL